MRDRRQQWAPNLTALLVCLTPMLAACGGASRPAPVNPTVLPSPTPSPIVTPTPRSTFTLNAPSDSGLYSVLLARLKVGSSIELEFTPMAVNEVSGEAFGHSIEFWLFSDTSGPIALEERGELDSALSLVWASRSGDWVVSSVTNASGYVYSSRRMGLPFGEKRAMLIRRTAEGRAEFVLDGERILELVNPEASERLFARAFATSVEVSYVPGVFGSALSANPMPGLHPALGPNPPRP